MSINLRQELTTRLVNELFGDFDQLSAAWEDRASCSNSFPKAKSRASLYRWLREGVPTFKDGSDHQYFGLCGMLDVDPLAIFDFDANGYFSKFAQIRRLVYYGRQSLGSIATMLDMYRPGDIWPSESIAQACYGHGWRAHHLTNQDNWNSTNYVLLRAKFQDGRPQHPRAVHIAYRRTGVPDTMWRFYGTVLSIDGVLELYSESGTFQKMHQMQKQEICFRTYFGGRPVEWRIASLHHFSLETEYPSFDNSVLTFTW